MHTISAVCACACAFVCVCMNIRFQNQPQCDWCWKNRFFRLTVNCPTFINDTVSCLTPLVRILSTNSCTNTYTHTHKQATNPVCKRKEWILHRTLLLYGLLRLQWLPYGDIDTLNFIFIWAWARRKQLRWQHNKQREKSTDHNRWACVCMCVSKILEKYGIESQVECFHSEIRFLLLHTQWKHVVRSRSVYKPFDSIWLDWIGCSVLFCLLSTSFQCTANRFQTTLTATVYLFITLWARRSDSNWM